MIPMHNTQGVAAHCRKMGVKRNTMVKTYLLELRLRGRHLEQLIWDVMVSQEAATRWRAQLPYAFTQNFGHVEIRL